MQQTLLPDENKILVKTAHWLIQQPAAFERACFTFETHFWLDGQLNSHKPWSYIKDPPSREKSKQTEV